MFSSSLAQFEHGSGGRLEASVFNLSAVCRTTSEIGMKLKTIDVCLHLLCVTDGFSGVFHSD